jgi:hypothetical protein
MAAWGVRGVPDKEATYWLRGPVVTVFQICMQLPLLPPCFL